MKIGTHQNLGSLLSYHASQRQQRFTQPAEGATRQFTNIQARGVDTFTRAEAAVNAQGLRPEASKLQGAGNTTPRSELGSYQTQVMKTKHAESQGRTVSQTLAQPETTSEAQSSEPRTYSQNDIEQLMKVFGAVQGDEGFDPSMDMNTDGKIDVDDLNAMLSNATSAEPQPAQDEPITYTGEDINNLTEIMGAVEGDDAFDAAMDMNADGKIDIDDLNYMLSNAEEPDSA